MEDALERRPLDEGCKLAEPEELDGWDDDGESEGVGNESEVLGLATLQNCCETDSAAERSDGHC